MKNLISILFIAGMFVTATSRAQTAVNFTANDCNAVSHTLFDELDADKVIVIVWVMPCGSCIAPALSAYTEVQNYASSHPGRVKYYLVDDYANTSCPSLSSWGTTNGISTPDAVFSNNAIQMSDYGNAGMPKIVVLGQGSHTVFFNETNGLNTANFNTGIINALGSSSISEIDKDQSNLTISPNPVSSESSYLSFELEKSSPVVITLTDALGKYVNTLSNENLASGTHQLVINTSLLSNGVYYVKLKTDEFLTTSQFIITK